MLLQALDRTSGQDNGLSVSTKDNNFGDSEAIEAILVNTNQVLKFYCISCVNWRSKLLWMVTLFYSLNDLVLLGFYDIDEIWI